MGIKDLLRFMKPYIEPIHIKKYAGKRVGIDAYSWLHKGAYSCNMELCLNSNGDKKLQYLKYFMHRINLLRHYKITPVVVFDGGNLPCKAATEQQRCMKRTANRELAMAKLEEGNVNAASELFQRAVSVTPSMAHQLIQILRSENIEFVVAPYEADAQLAYLSSLEIENGGIVAVITEDSDLMAYCCKAIVFKMDKYGNGEEIVMSNVFSSIARRPSFQNFNKDLFAGMCVLAGCDFLPSIPGIGIVRAHSHVSKYRNLHRVLSVLKIEKGNQMPEDYSKSFGEAIAVFQHAQIYDAQTKRLKHMNPIPQELMDSFDGDLDFLGPDVPQSVAIAIAEGNLDPINMVAFDHSVSSTSIPSKTFDQFIRPKSPKVSATESCFMVISSHKGITKNVTVTKQEQASNESKYLNEAAALEKMILPSKIHKTQEITVIHDDIPLKVPDNNPFKRRKVEESHFEHSEPISTQVSVVTNDDDLDIQCISPDSVSLEILDGYDTEKGSENEIGLKHESPLPVVTKEDDSELYITISSQDSIDTKPKKIAGGKRIAGLKGRKSEKSNQKSRKTPEGNSKCTNTILNFFSRV